MKKIFFISISLIALTCLVASAAEGDSAPPTDEPVVGGGPDSAPPIDGSDSGTNAPWNFGKFLKDSLGIDNIPRDLKVVPMVNEEGKRVLALNTRDPQIRVYIDNKTGETTLKNINANPVKSIPIREFEDQIAKNAGIQFTVNDQIKQIYAGWQSGPNRGSFPPIAALAFRHISALPPSSIAPQTRTPGSQGPRAPVGGGQPGSTDSQTIDPRHAGSRDKTGESKQRAESDKPEATEYDRLENEFATYDRGISKDEISGMATENTAQKGSKISKEIQMECYDKADPNRPKSASFYILTEGDKTLIIPGSSPEKLARDQAGVIFQTDELGKTAVAGLENYDEKNGDLLTPEFRFQKADGPNNKEVIRFQYLERKKIDGKIPGTAEERYKKEKSNENDQKAVICTQKLPDQDKIVVGKKIFNAACIGCHDGKDHDTLIGRLKQPAKEGAANNTVLVEAIRRINLPKDTVGRMPNSTAEISPDDLKALEAYLRDAATKEK